ncbi:MAG: hypothetical protein ABR586_01435 [Thermoplasmatota archaeon]
MAATLLAAAIPGAVHSAAATPSSISAIFSPVGSLSSSCLPTEVPAAGYVIREADGAFTLAAVGGGAGFSVHVLEVPGQPPLVTGNLFCGTEVGQVQRANILTFDCGKTNFATLVEANNVAVYFVEKADDEASAFCNILPYDCLHDCLAAAVDTVGCMVAGTNANPDELLDVGDVGLTGTAMYGIGGLWGNSYCTYHVAAPIIPLALDTGTAGSPVKITASGDGGCVHRGGSTYDFNFTVSGHTQDSSYHGTFLAFVEESSVTFRVPAASYPAANYHDSFDGLGGAASCAAGFASAMSNAMGRANAWAAGELAVIAT